MRSGANCFKNMTEKWKLLQLLPGEVNIISYCALGSAPRRPSKMAENLNFKMKSGVTALL